MNRTAPNSKATNATNQIPTLSELIAVLPIAILVNALRSAQQRVRSGFEGSLQTSGR